MSDTNLNWIIFVALSPATVSSSARKLLSGLSKVPGAIIFLHALFWNALDRRLIGTSLSSTIWKFATFTTPRHGGTKN